MLLEEWRNKENKLYEQDLNIGYLGIELVLSSFLPILNLILSHPLSLAHLFPSVSIFIALKKKTEEMKAPK